VKLLSIDTNKYDLLPEQFKVKRSKLFLKLVMVLENEIFHNPDKIREFLDIHMIEEDFEYMSIEELILLRCQGFLDNSKIYDLFPEEFDYLEGIPVLMWDQL